MDGRPIHEGGPEPTLPDTPPDGTPEADGPPAPEAPPQPSPQRALEPQAGAPSPTYAPPPAPYVPAPPPAPPPRVWRTLGRSLDLSLSASRELRRASLFIGLVTLATVGPFVAIVVAFGSVQGGFDWIADAALGFEPDLVPVDPAAGVWLILAGLVAILGYLVVSIESPIMAMALLAAHRIGRPITTREALRRSRQVFWRVVGATLLVGVILIIPNLVIQAVLGSIFGESEAAVVVSTIIGAIISAPFAYLVSGVVIGDVGAGEAVRRSTRLAKVSWRLAIMISAVSAVVAYIQLFALGAGADILARIGIALNIGYQSGTSGTLALAVILMLAVLSVGSLTFTLAALIAAPQVVAFLELTGYSAGVDRGREGSGEEPVRVRWLTIGMTILIGLGLLTGIAGVLTLI